MNKTMEKMARQGIHDLLDRVLDASIGDEWAYFRFTRYSNGSPQLDVSTNGIEYSERRPASELIEAITRAKVATDE